MGKYLNLISMITLLCSYCSNPTENENSAISVSIQSEGLKITNLVSERIYYFAVEQKFAARINWAPFFEGPGLSHWESEIINFRNIEGLEQPIVYGTKIIIYYWNDANKKNPKINGVLVKITDLPFPL